jgi:N-acetylglucosamine kinase-like BadF-type ATPase
MPLFLGVDGGQSSTKAVIGDESGRILGRGVSGPCNHVKTGDGQAKFVNALVGCVGQALDQAGLPIEKREFASACLGFSGGPADKESLIKELIWAYHLHVSHDAFVALVGATGGQPGIITISGTGSIAFGRNQQLQMARAGGWGYVFGDEGSAFDVARQALRASLRMSEGWGPKTSLHDALLEVTTAKDANQLMHWFYTEDYPRSRVATFARLVDEHAAQGDAVATAILHQAAADLANVALAVRGQIFQLGEPALVCPIGNTFQSDRLRERFRQIVELTDGNRFAMPLLPPAEGALWEAYRLAGIHLEAAQLAG